MNRPSMPMHGPMPTRSLLAVTRVALALGGLALALVLAQAASAAVSLTTPYPAVEVQAGETATFQLRVTSDPPGRVDLSVSEVPRGWQATLRGDGQVVTGVMAGRQNAPELELEVKIPPDARPGSQSVVVTATGAGGSATLPLDLRVAGSQEEGGVVLTGEFTELRGPSDSTFVFSLDLENRTSREVRFTLEAAGPEGWQVTARPSGERLASTVTVEAGGTSVIEVEADPPDSTPAGQYPIGVRVVGGGMEAQARLTVDITGDYAMSLTTPSQRLNADVQAGDTTGVPIVVVNEGTGPLTGIEMSATPPSGWRVEFEPKTIEVLAPGETRQVTARITPSDEAIAGDYVVTLRATASETDASMDLRATVESSRAWGAVGIGLIVAAVIVLALVFRRFGRR